MKSSIEQKTIAMVGGGSGGHVTPLLYLSKSLLDSHEDRRIIIVTDKSYYDRTKELFAALTSDKSYGSRLKFAVISSGKFRRYGRSALKEFTDLKTQFKNLADLSKILLGYLQSKYLKLKYRPSVIFCKGGHVAVPFCLATRGIPTIVHDSDSRPGISNRIVARWAVKVLQGLPSQRGHLAKEVGIPVSPDYRLYKKSDQDLQKAKLKLSKDLPIVLFMGGGLGSKALNKIVFSNLSQLISAGLQVVHLTGTAEQNAAALSLRASLPKGQRNHYVPIEFSNRLYELMAAADLVVSRAGATAFQEIANCHKAAIIVPAPQLTDQNANARILASKGINILEEGHIIKNPAEFRDRILKILGPGKKELANQAALTSQFARPESTEVISKIIESYIKA